MEKLSKNVTQAGRRDRWCRSKQVVSGRRLLLQGLRNEETVNGVKFKERKRNNMHQ